MLRNVTELNVLQLCMEAQENMNAIHPAYPYVTELVKRLSIEDDPNLQLLTPIETIIYTTLHRKYIAKSAEGSLMECVATPVEILRAIKNERKRASSLESLFVHVKRIRGKLGEEAITTIRGHGYLFNAQPKKKAVPSG